MRPTRSPALAFLLLASVAPLAAHVGSPDVFHEGLAGPYRLLVTVRPPLVVPGVAQIEVRSAEAGVEDIRIVPLGLTGAAAKFAPAPDLAVRSRDDPQFFTGQLWMMAVGSWKIRVAARGPRGAGELFVPVPALPLRTLRMTPGIGAVLAALGLLLSAGLVAIIRAAAREAELEPGAPPGPGEIRRSRIATGLVAALVAGALVFGQWWWTLEAESYARIVYRPLQLAPAIEPPGTLRLQLGDPGWLSLKRLTDLVPDHGYLMHLFVVRVPQLDGLWHLHPRQVTEGVFEQALPAMPAGRYQLFADVVHDTGVLDTAVAALDVPDVTGADLAGDDSSARATPVASADRGRVTSPLSDGWRMVWRRGSRPFQAGRAELFTFAVEDPDGRPAADLELYMGMPGHAVFLASDRAVFAHVHPGGTAPMAAVAMAQSPEAATGPRPAPAGESRDRAGRADGSRTGVDPHAGHLMAPAVPAEITFPYGLPKSGDYRIFVQVKRRGRVETGVFDVRVP